MKNVFIKCLFGILAFIIVVFTISFINGNTTFIISIYLYIKTNLSTIVILCLSYFSIIGILNLRKNTTTKN